MPVDTDVLSDLVILANLSSEANLRRLRGVKYMSPPDSSFTGEGFACDRCYWLGSSKSGDPDLAWCNYPSVRTWIEKRGCCNKYRYGNLASDP